MTELPDLSDLRDREALIAFLDWTHDVLHELIAEGVSPTGIDLFYDELRHPMRDAWKDVSPLFYDLEMQVRELNEEAMRRHGLYGAQLSFKLATTRTRSRVFIRSGTRWLLGRLLTSIDTLLDSILSAVPFGTAISEMKDAVKDAILDKGEH